INDAARRELREEVGIDVDASRLGDVVMQRGAIFDFEGNTFEQEEHYFVVRVAEATVDETGWTDIERRAILSHRWWTLQELVSTNDTVYPEGLNQLLGEIL
ncbi:MAG TPA: NUDIX domain-containing protein, partial [Chloroflexota bacterium]|nr:NUDIX domain-containing protein [Chloroflexota bacterium]